MNASAPTPLLALKGALQRERDAHAERYRQLTEQAPVRQRVAEGVAWYPVRIREQGYGFGEYPYVVVERMGQSGPHQLGGGKPCQLFSQSGTEQRIVNGTIHWVTGNTAHIILRDNEHPDWLDDGRIGVQLVFDASGFKDMADALNTVINAKDDRLAELRDIVFAGELAGELSGEPTGELAAGQSEALLNDLLNDLHNVLLNDLHNVLLSDLHNVLLSDLHKVLVVHGPPGTGKTTTLVKLLGELTRTTRPILVCAPSNAAVDVLTERCADAGLDVVRIGNLARIDPKVMEHTLSERWKQHPMSSEVKDLRKRADEFRRLAMKYKRSFGKAEMEQRKLLLQEARNIIADVRRIEQQATNMILDQADVITCTLVASRNEELRGRRFEYVVIDEAGQALDPAMCIPLLRAERLILAGDPYQLPPTILDQQAASGALGSTMLERLVRNRPELVTLLTEQYRMNHVIMSYSNQVFYGGKVTSHPSVEDHTLPIGAPISESLMIIDTSGRGWDESPGEGAESLENLGEAERALEIYDELTQHPGHEQWTVGIISPYRGQVRRINALLTDDQRRRVRTLDVDTVDSFQGSECDVIIITLVRSNTDSDIGFLKDIRRMNVAMTRARKKLVIIGDGSTIAAHPFYRGLWEYAEQHGTVRSAWE